MKTIAYLLHRFPGNTDTFIKREIRSLQKAGVTVHVVSVWKPTSKHATPASLQEWAGEVEFVLPKVSLLDVGNFIVLALSSPKTFFEVLCLALKTRRPGITGFIYQTFYLLESMLVAGRVRRLRPDQIHNHFGDHSGLVTMFAAKFNHIDYSISFHGPHIFIDGRYAAIREKVLNACFIRCISYFCRSQVVVFSGDADIEKLKVVHCGLDLKQYRFRAPRENVRQIFCAARLAPEKGFEFLLQAMAILVGNGHDINLRIAGDGPSRAHLQTLIEKFRLSSVVNLLGNITESEVTAELLRADLFVLPSLAEGVPVSLMEAMAAGVPVIATNIAGTSELIDDKHNGILVRPTDSQALAEAIQTTMADFPFRLSAAENARKRVEAEFDLDHETMTLNQHFQAVRKAE